MEQYNGNSLISKTLAGIITAIILAIMAGLYSVGVSVGKAEGRIQSLEDRVTNHDVEIKEIRKGIETIYNYIVRQEKPKL